MTEPNRGRATLWYEASIGHEYHTDVWRVALTIIAKPWHKNGLWPFQWEFVPAMGERVYPLIRLMLLREASAFSEVKRIGGKGKPTTKLEHVSGGLDVVDYSVDLEHRGPAAEDLPKKLGYLAIRDPESGNSTVGLDAPLLQVIRPQIDAPVSHEAMGLRAGDFVRPPYVVRPGLSTHNAAMRTNRTVIVTEHRTGVVFQQFQGKYKIDVRYIDPLMAGAFFYRIEEPEKLERNDFRVAFMHTGNVSIKVSTKTGHSDKVKVGAKRYGSYFENEPEKIFSGIAKVPRPGETPDLKVKLSGNSIKFQRNAGSPSVGLALVDALETAVGFVPLVGDLYDIGQLAYAAATGEDFWGRKVSSTELAVLGAAVLLPVSLPGR